VPRAALRSIVTLIVFIGVRLNGGEPQAQALPDAYRVGFGAGQAAAEAQSVPPPALRRGTARVAGSVVGVNGVPIRRATVRIAATDTGAAKTTLTDVGGQYELRDLPSGRYTVSAGKEGFPVMFHGQARPDAQPVAIELAENRSADAINVTLVRGGAIVGRVLDEFGEPLTDAQVMPLQKQYTEGGWRFVNAQARAAVTNDIGEFRIYGLRPGRYFVTVVARAAEASSDSPDRWGYPDTYFPSTTSASDAQPIAVGAGETTAGIDLTVMPARLATISGTALNSTGEVVRFGSIAVTSRDARRGVTIPTSHLRDDGTFTIPGLPPGEYLLRATAAIDVARTSTVVLRGSTQEFVADPLTATVVVNGSDVAGVVMAPTKTVSLSGKFSFDPAAAALLRRTPPTVVVSALNSVPSFNIATEFRSDSTFRVSVPAAPVMIKALVGVFDWVVEAIRVSGKDITDTGVDLTNGFDLDGIEIVLTNRPPEVLVTVVDNRGRPVPAVSVLMFPEDRKVWQFGTRLMPTLKTDTQGQNRVRTLPGGRYLAIAFEFLEPLLPIDPERLESLRSRATPVTLVEGEQQTLTLQLAADR